MQDEQQRPGSGYIMLISGDSTMVNRCRLQKFSKFSKFCAYPEDVGLVTTLDNQGEKVFVKEFVWETLLTANASPCAAMDEPPAFAKYAMLFTKHVTISSPISRVKNTERRLVSILPSF